MWGGCPGAAGGPSPAHCNDTHHTSGLDRYYLLPVVFAQIYFVAGMLDLLRRLPFFRHF